MSLALPVDMPNDDPKNFNLGGFAIDAINSTSQILGSVPGANQTSIWDSVYQYMAIPSIISQAASGGLGSYCKNADFGSLASEAHEPGSNESLCMDDIMAAMRAVRAPH